MPTKNIGSVQIRTRDSVGPMGPFGGGWKRKVGLQWSTITRKKGEVIVSLFVKEYRVVWGEYKK